MISIAYFSSAHSRPGPAELRAILEAARRNNAARGVTGLLCHHDGSFLQFLEGEEEDVEAVYARIAEDPRHHTLLRVHKETISERLFGDWSMAVVSPGELGDAHSRFCQALRQVEVNGPAEHAGATASLLAAFRTWLR